jgi:hypothetical protein
MILACLAARGNPGAILGLLAILCWLLLLCAASAFPFVAVRKTRCGVASLAAFLLGGLLAGGLMWQATRPEGLSLRESLSAGVNAREYGHPVEHRAEVAICFSSFAWVLGGVLCGGATIAGMRARREPA